MKQFEQPSVDSDSAKVSEKDTTHGMKVKRGQLNAVQRGRYGTGPAPYGYRRGNNNECPLEIDQNLIELGGSGP